MWEYQNPEFPIQKMPPTFHLKCWQYALIHVWLSEGSAASTLITCKSLTLSSSETHDEKLLEELALFTAMEFFQSTLSIFDTDQTCFNFFYCWKHHRDNWSAFPKRSTLWFIPKSIKKYLAGIQQGLSCLTERRCPFSL